MPNSDFSLTARARQFSSFPVMVRTVSGPSEFTPMDAIVLQNNDEVMIALLLNELPTAKEFKDVISSLSPEQQRFAKTFRGMQLESSVFGVCVVQAQATA
jgi:regulation of enolase protein 1 (concanavalin A-like superfamily)